MVMMKSTRSMLFSGLITVGLFHNHSARLLASCIMSMMQATSETAMQ
jgi:hypothetical protein